MYGMHRCSHICAECFQLTQPDALVIGRSGTSIRLRTVVPARVRRRRRRRRRSRRRRRRRRCGRAQT